MLENYEHFDINKKVGRMHLRPLIWVICLPDLIKHKNKLTKINMEGIKPPYLLLCNHNAFMDFKVAIKAVFPHRANFVVAIDGFLGRKGLLRYIGCICKRKFTRDISLIKQLKKVLSRGDIAALYPEARYSLCGTTAVLPDSLGKMAKYLKVPVVSLVCHGHHINSPFWNLAERKVKPTEAEMTCLFTVEQLEKASAEEINSKIRSAFEYDDFKWQKERNIVVDFKDRAVGLNKVLYQCPHCGKEYFMTSSGSELKCTSCGSTWNMNELGELEATPGFENPIAEFSNIPDWYEWERLNVRREVENGTYSFSSPVHVDSIPNDKFIPMGKATLTHNMEGFKLTGVFEGKDYEVDWTPEQLYSCHIEYEYLGKYGDCIDLNTLNDTFYIYPECEHFSVTKIALATEELFEKTLS